MNANTALKIREAIDQAVGCGESVPDILAQIKTSLLGASRRLAEDRLKEALAAWESALDDHYKTGDYVALGIAAQDHVPTLAAHLRHPWIDRRCGG